MRDNSNGASGDNAVGKPRASSGSRRRFLGTIGATGTSLALAGCLSGFTGGGGGETVQIAVSDTSGALAAELIEDHVAEETDTEVEVSGLPYDNLFETLATNLEQEDDTYTLFMMDDPWFPAFAEHCEPIEDHVDDLPTDQIIDTTLEIGTWPPTEYAAPPGASGDPELRAVCVVGNTQLFVYNEAIYEEVGEGEPETWEDVVRAGQAVEEEVEGTHGYAIRGSEGNPIMADFFGPANCLAGDMFDEDWNFRWSNEEGVAACELFTQDLGSISADGAASYDSEEVLIDLSNGSAAASAQWPSGVSTLIDPDESEEYENISSIVIPEGARRAPQQGNWLMGINTYADDSQKEDAAKILQSFVSKEMQEEYVSIGGVPFRHDTFEENLDAEPWFPALYESLQEAVPRPRTQVWNEIEKTTGDYLNAALIQEITPQEAMEGADEDIQSILSDEGYFD